MSASITDALAGAPFPDNVDITKDETVLSSENTDAQHAEKAQKNTIPHSARSNAAAEALADASSQDTSDNMKDKTVPHLRGPNALSAKQTLMTTLQFAKRSLIGAIRRSQPSKEYAIEASDSGINYNGHAEHQRAESPLPEDGTGAKASTAVYDPEQQDIRGAVADQDDMPRPSTSVEPSQLHRYNDDAEIQRAANPLPENIAGAKATTAIHDPEQHDMWGDTAD